MIQLRSNQYWGRRSGVNNGRECYFVTPRGRGGGGGRVSVARGQTGVDRKRARRAARLEAVQ